MSYSIGKSPVKQEMNARDLLLGRATVNTANIANSSTRQVAETVVNQNYMSGTTRITGDPQKIENSYKTKDDKLTSQTNIIRPQFQQYQQQPQQQQQYQSQPQSQPKNTTIQSNNLPSRFPARSGTVNYLTSPSRTPTDKQPQSSAQRISLPPSNKIKDNGESPKVTFGVSNQINKFNLNNPIVKTNILNFNTQRQASHPIIRTNINSQPMSSQNHITQIQNQQQIQVQVQTQLQPQDQKHTNTNMSNVHVVSPNSSNLF